MTTLHGDQLFRVLVLDLTIPDQDIWWEFCCRFMCLFDTAERLPEERQAGAREMIELMREPRPKLYWMAFAARSNYSIEATEEEILEAHQQGQMETSEWYAGRKGSDPRD